jgi:uncharacterized metal-binding protein YceD (DUF177 family)
MSALKAFNISIARLADKRYPYRFEVDERFFATFPESPVKKGNLAADLDMDKSATMLQLHFRLEGEVELICDRSLEPFDFKVKKKENLILKFGDEPGELTDEIEIIARDTQEINVAQYLYEFIVLAIPMKKIHPRFAKEKYIENEEGLLIYSSENQIDKSDEEDKNAVADPRFDILKKLNPNNDK